LLLVEPGIDDKTRQNLFTAIELAYNFIIVQAQVATKPNYLHF
jgi:hypothetical protein